MKKNEKNIREILKNIPSVDQLVIYSNNQFDITFPQALLKKIIKETVNQIRSRIKDNSISLNIEHAIYKNLDAEILKYSKSSMHSIINGTGIILHTGLGRAPINNKLILDSVKKIYPYTNLEFDVKNNSRGERNHHIDYLFNSVLNTESSLIVNNNAAAVLLILNSLSEKKDVIISRGELVEIGGSFRIPDIIKKANCNMVEIGTTNRTHLKDFKNSISDKTGLIMIAHTSNYKVVGFTQAVDVKDIVKIAKRKRIPVFLDLGSGALIDYESYGLPKEKLINEYIKMGIDIISFSGDKLIGGIQSGIICGKRTLVKKIHSNSMYRAMRCDKLTISIIESTLRTYVDKKLTNKNNLTFQLLTRDRKELKKIGNKILKNIDSNILKQFNIQLINSNVEAGSGSLPIQNINSMALVFKNKDIKPSIISKKFRESSYPVIGYIKSNNYYIDLKAIPNNQIKYLIQVINSCLV